MTTPTPHMTEAHRARQIIDAVCLHYGIDAGAFYGRSRQATIALARHVACYLIYRLTVKSYTEIGDLCGGRDHTTVMNSCQRVEWRIKTEAELAAVVSQFLVAFSRPGLSLDKRVRISPARVQVVGRDVDNRAELMSVRVNSEGQTVNSVGQVWDNSRANDSDATTPSARDTQATNTARVVHGLRRAI